MKEGYYKTFRQDWWEDPDSKTGWNSSGWLNTDDYEFVTITKSDKHGHPTEGLFKFTGAVFLGIKHAAMNIDYQILSDYLDLRDSGAATDSKKVDRINTVRGYLEEKFELKEYRTGGK